MRKGDTLGYYELNSFHSAIYAGTHNDYLEKITTETRARIAPQPRAVHHAGPVANPTPSMRRS